jgi:uncharacterized protein YndB with AHSA1/START domain
MAKKNETKIIAEPGKQELFIIREFDAPRELVFQAYTDPEMYKQWVGPRNLTMVLEKFEPRNGGSFRFIHKDSDGNEYPFNGVYHLVLAPELLIGTFEFEGLPVKGIVELDTARFEELPGQRTKLTIQAVYQSVANRDGMVKSGMEGGVTQGFEKLDELLKKMKSQ